MFTSTSLEVKLVRNLSFPVSFEIVGWNITHNFVYFSDLEQLAASFLATDILFLNRMASENFNLVFVS